MVLVPISPTIMKAYRDTLLIPNSPSFLDTDLSIQPVAIIAQAASESSAQFTKLTDGTDNLAILTNGGILTYGTPILATDNTSRAYTQTTDITAVTYTVTTGKTLHLTDLFSCPSATAGSGGRLIIKIYSDATLVWAGARGNVPATGTGWGLQANFITPLTFAGGVAVTIQVYNIDVTATFAIFNGFSGFEI